PIRRSEFLVGKYIGIVLTGAVFVLLMGSIQIWLLMFVTGGRLVHLVLLPGALFSALAILAWRCRGRSVILLPWSAVALGTTVFLAGPFATDIQVVLASLALIFGELLVLTAVALLFSSFSTPFLTGLFSLGVWLAGRSADDLVTMNSKLFSAWIKATLR